jgi:diguanylate cyclase (GGDEF)-like protein
MNVLIAEDDPVNLMLIQGVLAPLGQELTTARNGTEAVALMKDRIFDLFLFDVMMPDIDGFTLCRLCREDPRHRDVPILIITALSGKNDLIRAFEAGATDFVTKPFQAAELQYRAKAHLQQRSLQLAMERTMNELNLRMLEVEQKQQELEAKERQLSEANQALAEANKALLEFASRDSLTGLLNRRKGWDYMHYEEEKSRRSHRAIGVALVDLDKFKAINDAYGHETGDEVLKAASRCLSENLRGGDILIRWGGEEFLAVFPETDEEGLARAAEKIRQSVEAHPWNLPGGGRVTASVGTAVKTPELMWDKVLEIADKALYSAKRLGRNRVVSGSP